jgi:hypothetical protein
MRLLAYQPEEIAIILNLALRLLSKYILINCKMRQMKMNINGTEDNF